MQTRSMTTPTPTMTATAVSEEPAPAPEVEPPRLSTEELREILEERYSSACGVIHSDITYPLIESVMEPYEWSDDEFTEFTEFTVLFNVLFDEKVVRTKTHKAYKNAIFSYMSRDSPSLSLHAECQALLEAHYITMTYGLTGDQMLQDICRISLTYSDSWDESTFPDDCDVHHPANYSV